MQSTQGEKKKPESSFGFLMKLAGNNKNALYIAIIASILSGLCSFIPYVMVFRTVLFMFEGTENFQTVIGYGAIAAGAIAAKFLFQALAMALTHIGAYNILYVVRKKITGHLAEINLGFFTDNSSGEIKKVLIEDVERIEQFLAHQIPDIVVAIVVPITVFVYLLTINVPMALFLLVPVVLTVLIQVLAVVASKKQMDSFNQILGRLNSVIMQFINGMPVMKTYNLTSNSYKAYSDTITEYSAKWKSISDIFAPFSAVCTVIIESGIIFTLPLGGYLFLKGQLELSSYVFFMIMSMVFLTSYMNLLNFAQVFTQISSGLENVQKIMNIPAPGNKGNTLDKEKEYDVTFENVSFSYDKKEVLSDVNISLPKGSLTAFVGASGAGKSTAAQLIPRFWEVNGGSINIGGVNIADIKNENLMDLVSFVFQETFMLNDTIYQNIAIGKGTSTRSEVEEAAKAAQIHDFIMSLPNGYETHMGEDGVKMSGGEKQRICIARAILKDAPVIVFDEATSYTDIENEHKIQLALNNLLVGKTTIMIAHRLHTIVHADQICVFDEGRVKEMGTHDELVKKGGLYEKMWKIYIGYDGEEEVVWEAC